MAKIYYLVGKIRVRTLGNEIQEQEQKQEAKKRKETKDLKKGKAHVKGVGLKGGQQIKVIEGDTIKPEIAAILNEDISAEPGEKKVKIKKTVKKTRSRRYLSLKAFVDKKKAYPLAEALELLKKTSTARFDATAEAHININPEMLTKEKSTLSGMVNLPHGTGKQKKVVIADEQLLKKIEAGKIEFDILVAHPSMMPKLAKFARNLGPKGLMPNPKAGTVSDNPEKRAKEFMEGETSWKTEPKNPIVHLSIGKVSFGKAKLKENLTALVKSISANKIAKLTLSSTMGPGIRVDVSSI